MVGAGRESRVYTAASLSDELLRRLSQDLACPGPLPVSWSQLELKKATTFQNHRRSPHPPLPPFIRRMLSRVSLQPRFRLQLQVLALITWE